MAFALLASFVGAVGPTSESRAATGSSLTIYTTECAEPLALDGTPITTELCETTEDRTFQLTGPDGQSADLETRLLLGLDGPRFRIARWTVDAQDDREDEGTYTLTELDANPSFPTLYACLLASEGDLVPADLTPVDGGFELDWDPAVATADGTEGDQLICDARSRPVDRGLPAAGVVQIHAGAASLEGDSDLIVRAAGDEPYNLRDAVAADVPELTYTLTDDAGDDITLTAPGIAEGIAVTSFQVAPGTYILTVDATGTSRPVTIESGRTILAFNPLGETIGSPDDGTTDLGESEPTPTPSPDEGDSGPTPSPDEASQIDAVDTFAFTAADWDGAYADVRTDIYARDCVAVYGAGSPNPVGVLTFELDAVAIGNSELVLTGLDDEVPGGNPLVITVNGETIFDGESPFNDWIPDDPNVPWDQLVVPFGNGVLVEGRNEIVVSNLSPGGAIGTTPYILLSEASLTVGQTAGIG